MKMSTLPSLVLRSPSSPVLFPVAGYDPPAGVISASFKERSCSRRSASRSRVGCSSAEHGVALDELKFKYGVSVHRLSLRKARGGSAVARKARALDLRCQAHLETEFWQETDGTANDSETRDIRLKGIGVKILQARLYPATFGNGAIAGTSTTRTQLCNRYGTHRSSSVIPAPGVRSWLIPLQYSTTGFGARVWAMDFLGQGKSWPSHDPAPREKVVEEVAEGQSNAKALEWCSGKITEAWAIDLVYSVDTWRDQVHAFLEKVVGEPVYIVGNSLGGFVGTYFAATNSELVKGVALLNATPIWALMPNARRNPLLTRLVPWGGLLPVPVVAKAAVRVWGDSYPLMWNLLRNPQILRSALNIVYADRSVINEELVQNMVEATDHPAAFAAFASIIFAPRAHTNFGENLISLKEKKIPVCMIYGKEDPWIVPIWGQRAKQRNSDAIYYELSPAGHCPHHEAPEVVNVLLRRWVESVQSEGALSPCFLEAGVDQKQNHWFEVGQKRVSVRVKGTQGFWSNLLDSIREIFSKRSLQSQVVETVEKAR